MEDCNYIQYKEHGAWRTATIYSVKSKEDCNYIECKKYGGLHLYAA